MLNDVNSANMSPHRVKKEIYLECNAILLQENTVKKFSSLLKQNKRKTHLYLLNIQQSFANLNL